MSTELTVRQQLNPSIWQTITAVAPVMKDSRLFGVTTEAQACAIMAKGYELGLQLTTAFEFIQVIEGKPTLSPRGALALVMQSGMLEDLKIEDLKDDKGVPSSCRVTMKRAGGFTYAVEFSMDDARRAALVKPNGGWDKYPANMLRWRAIGYCIDVTFSDVTGGMKRADEFGANIDFSGNVVDAQWTPVPAPAVLNTDRPAGFEEILQNLVSGYGADIVLAANNGQIPTTFEEIATVTAMLEAQQ